MHDDVRLADWDLAVTAYLSSRHTLGRAYRKEEPILGNLRRFLVQTAATDLDQTLFDQWRARLHSRSPNTRVIHDQTVFKFCCYRRRSEPGCFMPDRHSLARGTPSPLPMVIEPDQVAQLLAYVSTLRSVHNSPLQPQVMRLAVVLL